MFLLQVFQVQLLKLALPMPLCKVFLANTFVSEASTNVKYVQRGLSKILNIKANFCNLAFVAWPYEESCSTSESRRRLARDWGWT